MYLWSKTQRHCSQSSRAKGRSETGLKKQHSLNIYFRYIILVKTMGHSQPYQPCITRRDSCPWTLVPDDRVGSHVGPTRPQLVSLPARLPPRRQRQCCFPSGAPEEITSTWPHRRDHCLQGSLLKCPNSGYCWGQWSWAVVASHLCVLHLTAPSKSPRSLLERHTLRPHPRPENQKLGGWGEALCVL